MQFLQRYLRACVNERVASNEQEGFSRGGKLIEIQSKLRFEQMRLKSVKTGINCVPRDSDPAIIHVKIEQSVSSALRAPLISAPDRRGKKNKLNKTSGMFAVWDWLPVPL